MRGRPRHAGRRRRAASDPRRVRLRARAGSADEAIALLGEHGDEAKLLAGGHSLLPLMKLRLATPSVLVDVGRLDDLSYIAATTATTIAIGGLDPPPRPRDDRELLQRAGAAARARRGRGRRPAGPPPRHARRLAGARRPGVRPPGGGARARRHDRRRKDPAAGARSRPTTSSRVPRDRAGARRDAHRDPGPEGAGAGWAFQKFNRRAQDWAIVGVAAVGARRHHRHRAGEHGRPRRCGRSAVEAALRSGASPADAAALAAEGTEPPTDLNATPEYRRHLATGRCVRPSGARDGRRSGATR